LAKLFKEEMNEKSGETLSHIGIGGDAEPQTILCNKLHPRRGEVFSQMGCREPCDD